MEKKKRGVPLPVELQAGATLDPSKSVALLNSIGINPSEPQKPLPYVLKKRAERIEKLKQTS